MRYGDICNIMKKIIVEDVLIKSHIIDIENKYKTVRWAVFLFCQSSGDIFNPDYVIELRNESLNSNK